MLRLPKVCKKPYKAHAVADSGFFSRSNAFLFPSQHCQSSERGTNRVHKHNRIQLQSRAVCNCITGQTAMNTDHCHTKKNMFTDNAQKLQSVFTYVCLPNLKCRDLETPIGSLKVSEDDSV